MSVLHSSRAPWLMLTAFAFCAMAFFSLAVGRDVGLVSALFDPKSEVTLKEEIPRLLARGEQRIVALEQEILHGVGSTLEHAGRRLSGEQAVAPQPTPAIAPPTAPTPPPSAAVPTSADPGTLLFHQINQDENLFQGDFAMDRTAPTPKVFFMSSPAVWVVDLPGSWTNHAPHATNFDQGFIRRVTIGEHPDYLRLVFHFRNRDLPPPAHRPVVTRLPNSLTVAITRPDDDG